MSYSFTTDVEYVRYENQRPPWTAWMRDLVSLRGAIFGQGETPHAAALDLGDALQHAACLASEYAEEVTLARLPGWPIQFMVKLNPKQETP